MSLLNLFISSSDSTGRSRVQDVVRLGIWVIIGLFAFDAFLNAAFQYPSDPKNIHPTTLQRFFDYGRSSEAKLARMVRPDKLQTAPITLAGWYDPLPIVRDQPVTADARIVTIYGMSHAVRLGEALGRVSKRYLPRIIGAPGASANWAYGAYLRDHGGGKSSAVVLALWSQNLAMITSASPMIWNSDEPMPYTADLFSLEGDRLEVTHPPYTSFNQFTRIFYDPKRWAVAMQFFAERDSMYNSFIMRASMLDHSALLRLVRRAYAQRVHRDLRQRVLDSSGFHPDSPQIRLARKMIGDFAENARRNGMIPVIYLVNGLGDSNYLYQAVKPALLRDNIPYLSSDTIASPADPRKYLPDSHFTAAVDDELARALAGILGNPSTH